MLSLFFLLDTLVILKMAKLMMKENYCREVSESGVVFCRRQNLGSNWKSKRVSKTTQINSILFDKSDTDDIHRGIKIRNFS